MREISRQPNTQYGGRDIVTDQPLHVDNDNTDLRANPEVKVPSDPVHSFGFLGLGKLFQTGTQATLQTARAHTAGLST